MSSTNSFATLYKKMPHNMVESEAETLNIPHDDTRSGMIHAFMQTRDDASIKEPRRNSDAVPPTSQVTNKMIGHDCRSTTAPSTPLVNSTEATAKSVTPEPTSPASPIKKATTSPNDEPFRVPMTRHASWADEKEEELEQAAAAEAEAKAAVKKDTGAGWATVEKPKKRSQRRKKAVEGAASVKAFEPSQLTQSTQQKGKADADCRGNASSTGSLRNTAAHRQVATPAPSNHTVQLISEAVIEPAVEEQGVAATNTPPDRSVETKKMTPSRRRKQKKAAKKAKTATISSPPSSEAIGEKTNNDTNNSDVLPELKSLAKELGQVSTTSPEDAEVRTRTSVLPVGYTVVDPWDDYINTMPTIEIYNFHIARDRAVDAGAETWARFAAAFPLIDNGAVIATELQRRQKQGHMAEQTKATLSIPAGVTSKIVTDNSEGLLEPQKSNEKVLLPSAPPSPPTTELVSDVFSGASAEGPKQLSILDFFKKVPVVTTQEISTPTTPARISPPGEAIKTPATAAKSIVVTGPTDDLLDTSVAVTTEPDLDGESVFKSARAISHPGLLSKTDGEVEDLPAPSVSIVSSPGDIHSTPAPTLTESFGQKTAAPEDVHASQATRIMTIISDGDDAREPFGARSKKKRTKAERNAAKKRTAAAAVAAFATSAAASTEKPKTSDAVATTNVLLHDALPQTALTGRGKRRQHLEAAKPHLPAIGSKKDAQPPTFTSAGGKFAKSKETIINKGQKTSSVMDRLYTRVTAGFRKTDSKEVNVETELSLGDIVAAHAILSNQTNPGKNQVKQDKHPRDASQRKAWKKLEPVPPPGVREALAAREKRKGSGLALRLKARLAAASNRVQISGVEVPWLWVLLLVLTALSAIGPIVPIWS